MKPTLKNQILEKRNSLTKEEIKEKSDLIKSNLYSLQEFKEAKNILFYVSFNSEVGTQTVIKELLKNKGGKIIVPYVAKNDPILQLSELGDFNELEPRTFNILEPKQSYIKEFNPEKLDLIIIPGVVFDLKGQRIGYGYGYYDRFLKTLRKKTKKIGLAYELQIVEKIPEERHDIPVDVVVSEERIIRCANKKH
jgi:5-formyltetrahydrofolate cyclo-ligase